MNFVKEILHFRIRCSNCQQSLIFKQIRIYIFIFLVFPYLCLANNKS